MSEARDKVGWAAAQLTAAAIDAGLAVANLPQVAGPLVAGAQGLVGVGQAVFNRNAAEAGTECERTLEATPGAQAALEQLRGDVDELHRRMTIAFRLIMEAGRHPDRELRLALGRFASRSLTTDLDAIEAFELADVLSRLTALDYALLELTERVANMGIPDSRDYMFDEMAARFPKFLKAGENDEQTARERLRRSSARLEQVFHLTKPGPWSITPTSLGLRLLTVTRAASLDS